MIPQSLQALIFHPVPGLSRGPTSSSWRDNKYTKCHVNMEQRAFGNLSICMAFLKYLDLLILFLITMLSKHHPAILISTSTLRPFFNLYIQTILVNCLMELKDISYPLPPSLHSWYLFLYSALSIQKTIFNLGKCVLYCRLSYFLTYPGSYFFLPFLYIIMALFKLCSSL